MLASARYELRLAALPPDALIAITAGAMRDSPAANRRAEALLAHHSPPPAVATDVLADPDLAPCVLEKTGLRHAAVCKRWSLICAPRGAFARLVETAGDASSELRAVALGELRRLSGEEAGGRRVDALSYVLETRPRRRTSRKRSRSLPGTMMRAGWRLRRLAALRSSCRWLATGIRRRRSVRRGRCGTSL